jgi:hypothetical protein
LSQDVYTKFNRMSHFLLAVPKCPTSLLSCISLGMASLKNRTVASPLNVQVVWKRPTARSGLEVISCLYKGCTYHVTSPARLEHRRPQNLVLHTEFRIYLFVYLFIVFLGILLGPHTKEMWKATVGFVISLFPSVHPNETTWFSCWTDFCEIWYWGFFFLKLVDQLQFKLKSNWNYGHYVYDYVHFNLLKPSGNFTYHQV